MNILALVLAGHFLGDWIVQTDWQAAGKVRPESQVCPLHGEGPVCQCRAFVNGVWRPTWADLWPTWRANQAHMLGYHITLAALVGPAWHDWWALAALATSWLTHSFIDRRWPVRWLCDHSGSHVFGTTTFGVIAVDQALHLSILCLLVAAHG